MESGWKMGDSCIPASTWQVYGCQFLAKSSFGWTLHELPASLQRWPHPNPSFWIPLGDSRHCWNSASHCPSVWQYVFFITCFYNNANFGTPANRGNQCTLEWAYVQKHTNGNDCGVFAINYILCNIPAMVRGLKSSPLMSWWHQDEAASAWPH